MHILLCKNAALKITFLGTGTSQGVPVIACDCRICKSNNPKDQRLRSAVLVEVDGQTFVIDAGPDFRQQMLREHVSRLDAMLITHGHKDHIGGLDDVRAFNYTMQQYIDIYAQADVHKAIEREYAYAFGENKYPGTPRINLIPIENKSFSINDIQITPVEVMHMKLPVFGFRTKDFTYITDANYISKKEKEKIKGSKVLVLNALRKEEHISHFNLKEAISVIEEIKPEKAYLTHISHLMGLHEVVENELPDNIHLAYDGLTLNL